MKNILRDGDKPEVIKIMPTVALALMLALSGCKDVKNDTETVPEKVWEIGEQENVSDWVTLEHHPDYALKKDMEGYEFTNGKCINPDTCVDKSIILKDGGEIYVRADLDSLGAPVFFIGSYADEDSTETQIGPGVLVIESDKK